MYKVMGRQSQKAALLQSRSPLSALCVVRRRSVSKFPVSFCLIRNLTMFSLVAKKKQKTQKTVERNNKAAISIQL